MLNMKIHSEYTGMIMGTPYPLLHLEYDLNISNSNLPTALLNPASPSFSSKWIFDANKSLFK